MRAVIDTSVVITGLRSGSGAAAETLRRALRCELTLLMDYKLACEYRQVALRPEHLRVSGKSAEQTELLLDALEAIAEPVYVAFRYRPLSQHANDDMALDVAINGNADVIVTNNARHFQTAARRFQVMVKTPADLLSGFRERR